MPLGYEKARLEIACSGLEHENVANIYAAKINVLGGMNFISVDNINKANTNRGDHYKSFIKAAYPYIKLDDDSKKKKPENTSYDDLIDAYKEIFGDQQAQVDQKT
jgi:hypothetical protein